MKSPSFGLRAQSGLALLLVCVLALAATSAIVWRGLQQIEAYYGSAFARNYVLLLKQRMVAPINRELALAQRLARSHVTRDWAQNENDPALRARFFREVEGYRADFVDRSYFVALAASNHYYFNDDKRPISDQPRYRLNAEKPSEKWFAAALADPREYSLNVSPESRLGPTKVWFNFIIREGDQRIGITGSGLDLSRFIGEFVGNPEPGVTNFAVTGNGAIQAHRNRELIAFRAPVVSPNQGKSLFDLLATDAERDAARLALAAAEKSPAGASEFHGTMDGQKQLFAVSWSPELQWHMIAAIDLDAARVFDFSVLGPILLAGCALLLICLLGFLIAVDRIVLRPISRLTAVAQALPDVSGDLPHSRRGDEIGLLTRAFSGMAERVRGHAAELEQQVAQRTRELESANRELARLSERDALTGIGNRRMLTERLDELEHLQHHRRGHDAHGPISLAMLDVDHFKSINDIHGHDVGDRVLYEVAQAIHAEMRATDTCGRWGGEEFMIVLPETSASEAMQVAERIRRAIVELPMAFGNRVTASVGVATRRAEETMQALVGRADAALYQAKREGRNRTCEAE